MNWVRSASGAAAVAAASAACGVGIALTSGDSVGVFAMAVALFALTLAVTIRIDYRRNGDAFSVLIACAAFYTVAFLIGGVFAWRDPTAAAPAIYERSDAALAVILAAAAWALFAIGYFASPFAGAKLRRHRLTVAPTYPWLGTVALLGLGWSSRIVLYLEGRYYHVSDAAAARGGGTWFLDAFSQLPLIAVAVVLATAYANPRRRAAFATAWLLLVVEFAWALPTGSRTRLVTVAAVAVLVRYYGTRRLPSLPAAIVAVGALVFVVFPFGSAYRQLDYRTSPTAAMRAAADELLHGADETALDRGETTLSRFSDAAALARLLHEGRGRIDFTTAETARRSAEAFLPRAVFPEKEDPSAFANDFGRAYGFVVPTNYSTAIAVTQVGELYLGGGLLAVVLGMPLLGALYRGLDSLFRRRSQDVGAAALYASVLPAAALGLETSIAIGFVGVVKFVLVAVACVVVAYRLAAVGPRVAVFRPAGVPR